MNRLIDWIKKDYFDREGSYFLGALLAVKLLPMLFCSVTMMVLGHGLPGFWADGYEVVGIAAAFFLCMRALFGRIDSGERSRYLAMLTESGLWLIAALLVNSLLSIEVMSVTAVLRNAEHLGVWFIGYFILRFIVFFLIGAGIYACFIQLMDSGESIHAMTLLRITMRSFPTWVFGTLIAFTGMAADYFVSVWLQKLNLNHTMSFAGHVVLSAVSSVILYIFIMPIFNRFRQSAMSVVKRAEKKQEKRVWQEEKKQRKQEMRTRHDEKKQEKLEARKRREEKKQKGLEVHANKPERNTEEKDVKPADAINQVIGEDGFDGERNSELMQEVSLEEAYLTEAEREAEEDREQVNRAERKPIKHRTIPAFVYRLLPVALIMLLIWIVMIKNPIESRSDAVLSGIAYDTVRTAADAAAGDYIVAASNLKIAKAHVLCWQGYLENNPTLIQQAIDLDENYTEPQLLMAYYRAEQGQSALFEQGIRRFPEEPCWYFGLLNSYEAQSELNENQKALRREALLYLISNGIYVDNTVIPDSLSERDRKRIAQSMELYECYLSYCNEFQIKASVILDGGVELETVEMALDYAEEYPDNILLQQIAYRLGSGYTYELAQHYRRTVDAAKRFDHLFMANYEDKKKNKGMYIAEKCEIASVMIEVRYYEDAVSFLRNAQKTEESAEFLKLLGVCYQRLEEWETSLNYATQVLKEEPEDADALYLAAMDCLKMGEAAMSLEYGAQLCSLMLANENPDTEAAYFYSFAQNFAAPDEDGRSYHAYDHLAPQSKTLLDENEFLGTTMEIIYGYDRDGNSEELLAKVKGLQKLKPGVFYTSYLEGNILFDLERFGEAEKAYLQSLEDCDKQPYVWYLLAVLYHSMGNDAESIKACKQVMNRQPGKARMNDPYLVTLHAEELMESLQSN